MNGISDKNKQSVKTKPDAHLTEIWFKSLLHHNEGLLFPVVSFSFSEHLGICLSPFFCLNNNVSDNKIMIEETER